MIKCWYPPYCETQHCGLCLGSQYEWLDWGRWRDDGLHPWSEHQKSREVVLVGRNRMELESGRFEPRIKQGLKLHWHLRNVRRRLDLSFLRLLMPALEGDSSFTLVWLESLEEFWELKWVGTWRASPPWEAKVALQPPTTHFTETDIGQSNYREKKQLTWTLSNAGL